HQRRGEQDHHDEHHRAQHDPPSPPPGTTPTGHDLYARRVRRGRRAHGVRLLRAAGQRAHSCLTFWRRTIAMRTGAPTSAVMIPTSISAGRATTRPTTSETVTRTAPVSAENGSSQRWSTPTSSRQTWGTMSPTNAIGPAT